MENKKHTIVILALLMMTSVLAYYPGETIVIPNEMNIENLVYTIIDNSTKVSNLNITINSTNITITFPQDMTPDSFTIVFIEEQTKEVVKIIRSGGGGGTRYVDRNVSVIQPLFIDRNITQEVEVIKFIEGEDNIIVEEGYELWQSLFVISLISILFFILWWKFKN